MTRKSRSKIGIDWPSLMMKATPRNAAIVPSVAITALTRPTVTISPLTKPAAMPTATPAAMLSVVDPVQTTTVAMQTVDMPTTEPTEISSPPEMMTMVCAVASTPRMAMAWPMFWMLRARKKTSGLSAPKIATRTASAIKRLRLCVPISLAALSNRPRPMRESVRDGATAVSSIRPPPATGFRAWRGSRRVVPSPRRAALRPRSVRPPSHRFGRRDRSTPAIPRR